MIPALAELLANSPDPGPVPPDLKGWKLGAEEICAHCTGRLVQRGTTALLRGWEPVWSPGRVECPYCAPRD